MDPTDKNLAKVFGISDEKHTEVISIPSTSVIAAKTQPLAEIPKDEKINPDIAYAKENLKKLAGLAMTNVEDNKNTADAMQEPRMYMALNDAIRVAKEILTDLGNMEIEKERVEIEKNQVPQITAGDTNIQQNIVFSGTPAELLDKVNPERALNKGL